MHVLRITPIRVVDAIEPLLPFWQTLGFATLAEVPHEGRAGFVLLARDGHHVMFQTLASVAADLGADLAATLGTLLYLDVDSIERAQEATAGMKRLVELRTTSYGAREFWVRDPSGGVVGFAEHHE